MAEFGSLSFQDDEQQQTRRRITAPPLTSSYDSVFGGAADTSTTPSATSGVSTAMPRPEPMRVEMPSSGPQTTATSTPGLQPSWDPSSSFSGVDPGFSTAAERDFDSAPDRYGMPKVSPDTQRFAQTSGYKQTLDRIQQTQDPQQQAVLKDQLARTLFSNLKTSGHDVKWNGDQLIVDGRPYVVGGGQGLTQPTDGPVSDSGVPQLPGAPAAPRPDLASFQAQGFAGQGWDPAKWADEGHNSPKYLVGRALAGQMAQIRQLPPDQRQAFVEQQLRALAPQIEAQGWTVHDIRGEKVLISGDGNPPHWADAVVGIDGDAPRIGWNTDLEQRTRVAMPMTSATSAPGGAAGVAVNNPSIQAILNANPQMTPEEATGFFNRYYVREGGPLPTGPMSSIPGADGPTRVSMPATAGMPTGAGMTTAAGAPAPGGQGGFTRTGPTYTPGEIDMSDLDGFSYEDIMGDLGPGLSDADTQIDLNSLPGLGSGDVDPATEELVMSILRNPESLDPRMVDTLKAMSKEELAELTAGNQDDLRRMGEQMGIGDSRWLGSELLAEDRARDSALIKSNRDIDVRAAETRAGDRRAAAALGQSYAESKSGRNRADRAQAFGEKQTNLDNLFKNQAERRASVALASDTALSAAAQRGDRMALRESINQKAAELGLAGDELSLRYTLGLLDDATRRHGIDVGAQIDREKLRQAGREFQEDLAFRIMALSQADRQFGAQYGLDFSRLNHQIDQDHWGRYADVFGG